MARRLAIPVHGGEGGGPVELEELRLLVREVILPEFEPVLRRMMQEEMHHVLLGCMNPIPCPAPRNPSNQNQRSITSHFQLHFNNEMPETIFTGNIIQAKGSAPLQLFITDDDKRKITSGPLSMIKIEIVVLDGDFGDEEQGNWTVDEFSNHVLCERKGRVPLLKGNQFITLKGGVGNVCSISFTDNSKWTRTQKFRLGARLMQGDHVKERVQEAISEAFYVNDHRGEYTMKHHIPLLEDEVWRLKNIRKDGPYHRRLLDHGIRTVEDFLKSLVIDANNLCNILFGRKIANKKWKTIVQHAWKCDLGCKCYSYTVPGHRIELAFNSVFQVIAARFGNCMWQPLHQLPAAQQDLVNRFKCVAYDNHREMLELNDPTDSLSGLPPTLLATRNPDPETNSTDVHHTNVQTRDEVHETDPPADLSDPSVSIHVEDSNHVVGEQETSFFVESCCSMDGDFDQEALFAAIESCNRDKIPDWSTRGTAGTESCSNTVTVQPNNLASHIPRSKWVKLRLAIKLGMGTSIRKSISARRIAKQIRWFSLLTAVKFGRSIRKRAIATRRDRLFYYEQSCLHGLSPLPFTYPAWPQEDNYF